MTGAEIVIKQGCQYGYFKFRHDGYFIDEYLIADKADLKNKTIQEVLQQIITTFMATYGDPKYEIETSYNQGFYTSLSKPLDLYSLKLTQELGSINDLLEDKLRKDLAAKGLDEDDEGLFCGYGDYMVYIDLDSQRIYGLYNDESGDDVVYNFDQQILEESNEG